MLYVSWNEFEEALVARVGSHRPHAIFCEQTNFSSSTFYKWHRLKQVPQDAFDQIETIIIENCDTARFKGFLTHRFFNRVVELSNSNVPIKTIALTMSVEMKRKVTEGAIKSARYRMKDRIPGYRTRGS